MKGLGGVYQDKWRQSDRAGVLNMDRAYRWTSSHARLQWVKSPKEGKWNWLFLPGGPGLGSESLSPLWNILDLPGNMWRLDLPGDGSNRTPNCPLSFSQWAEALVEAVSEFEEVVLIAHSTGGMFALSVPEIESVLRGLVLLDSAPNAEWQALFAPEAPLSYRRFVRCGSNPRVV